jgi:hypothetical protein
MRNSLDADRHMQSSPRSSGCPIFAQQRWGLLFDSQRKKYLAPRIIDRVPQPRHKGRYLNRQLTLIRTLPASQAADYILRGPLAPDDSTGGVYVVEQAYPFNNVIVFTRV